LTGKPADAAKERRIERLHAKIGQLIVERDFFGGEVRKMSALDRRAKLDIRHKKHKPSARAPNGQRRPCCPPLLLASLGLIGHDTMQTGAEGAPHRANHAVHLLRAGASIGGLIPFAMCLNACRDEKLRRDAVRAMTGFSFWGQIAVAAIVLTGGVNIALTSGRPQIPRPRPTARFSR